MGEERGMTSLLLNQPTLRGMYAKLTGAVLGGVFWPVKAPICATMNRDDVAHCTTHTQ